MLTVRFEAIPCYLIMRVKVKVAQFCTDSLSVTPRTIHSPWNSPGQKTGVGSCSLLQGIFPTQGSNCRSPALQADSLPAEPQGKPKNTGVGSPSLLQWVFLTQELNQGLLHCKQILYKPSFKGSPRMLEWVDYPFSSGSSWPKNWTRVSCIAGWFFFNWTNREALKLWLDGTLSAK